MSVVKKVTLASLARELMSDVGSVCDRTRRGVRAGARQGQAILMENTPVDTGRLRASTRTVDTPEGADIEQPTDYAGIVDHRQGYAGDVVPAIGDAVVANIKREFGR